MIKKALFNWSSGKDSALALYKTLKNNDIEILTLLTSISKPYQRISMHGVRVTLLEQQAKSIGIPLHIMELPEMPSMEVYEKIMQDTIGTLQEQGVTHSIFGDIFLEDLRAYREEKLALMGLEGIFPLWKEDTRVLLEEFLNLGFKTIVTCVNSNYLDKSFVGRIIDDQFLLDLPKNVDVCGENGEFHTFTFDGPLFKYPIEFEIGDIVYKTYEKPKEGKEENVCGTNATEKEVDYGFWYCDLLPVS